jgi:tetratricopeptide (TPR) repeat protein
MLTDFQRVPYFFPSHRSTETQTQAEDFINIGINYGRENNWEETTKQFKNALRIDSNPQIHHFATSYDSNFKKNYYLSWATAFFETNDQPQEPHESQRPYESLIDKAIDALNNAMSFDANDFHCHFLLGICYERKKRFNEAINEYQRCLGLIESSTTNEAIKYKVYLPYRIDECTKKKSQLSS